MDPILDFQRLLKAGLFSDFTIICQSTEIRVHKIILGAQSGYFAALFKRNMKEAQEGVVTFDDIDPEVMKHLVEFFYNEDRKFTFNSSDLKTSVSVWILAERLQATQAMQELEDRLINHLQSYENMKAAVDESLRDMVFSHPACAKSDVGFMFAVATWVVFAKSDCATTALAPLTKYTELMHKMLLFSHHYMKKRGSIFDACESIETFGSGLEKYRGWDIITEVITECM
ncbi:BTB/POZ protein [Colletotrichum navitas]|uniref:BTB/POZ protein n=1 Tax=Colletotrichum navitas TaxID=681940 RepID=A0AAD8Q6M1_9PEZI|nr:BTB/POZ protein [Colletotrichum navitas]KAK1596895.1 BTB/POZ protein [Colletotrichum navitas]